MGDESDESWVMSDQKQQGVRRHYKPEPWQLAREPVLGVYRLTQSSPITHHSYPIPHLWSKTGTPLWGPITHRSHVGSN